MCKQPARKPVHALVNQPDLAAVWKLAKAGGARNGLSKSAATAEISMTVPVDNDFRCSETILTIRWRNLGLGFDSSVWGDPLMEFLVLLDPIGVYSDGIWKLLQEIELTRRDSGLCEETKPRLDERRQGRKGGVLEGNLEE